MIPFEQLLSWKEAGSFPDDIPPLIQALLLESAGDWTNAHRIAQNDPSSDGSWVHAYLHRVEGDPETLPTGTRMPGEVSLSFPRRKSGNISPWHCWRKAEI